MDRKKLETQSRQLSISDRVEFLGNVHYEKLPEYYAKADIFVRPSRTEGLGSAFLESMAAGLITVGTPVGGIPDFLEDGINGFLTKPNDAEDLAIILQKALTMKDDERAAMIERARATVRERFLWNTIAKQMSKAFEPLLASYS